MPIDPSNPNLSTGSTNAAGTPNLSVGTGVGVPAATNIDPNASLNAPGNNPVLNPPAQPAGTVPALGPSPQTPSQQAQNLATSNAQNPPTTGGTTLFTPDALTKQQAASVQQANLNVVAAWDAVNAQQKVVDDLLAKGAAVPPETLQAASSTLNTLYAKLTSAEQNVQSANNNYGAALDKAIVDPSQANLQNASAEKARADAKQAEAATSLLDPNIPNGTRALNAAQIGLYSANQAKAYADAAQDNAQSQYLGAQTAQINALIGTPSNPGPLIQKATAEVGQVQAETSTTAAQGRLYDANADQAKANAALVNAQIGAGIPQAQAASEQSTAELNRAKIQQAQQGPFYGYQDQLNAIKAIQQQVFDSAPPGADLDKLHQQATDLLNQWVNSTIGGTTPYAASVAAANAGQNIFQTQAAMSNQASQAAASRANAFLGAGGSVLATLAGMNANAPAGSTAMAGAFQDVMRYMAGQTGQGQFAPPTQPAAPALPGFLQRFAGGEGGGGGQTTAPVTINIGGQGGQQQQQAAAALPMPNPAAAGAAVAMPSMPSQSSATIPNNFSAMPGGPAQSTQLPTTGAASPTAMPSYLNGLSSPTMGFLQQLWSPELQSGRVSM